MSRSPRVVVVNVTSRKFLQLVCDNHPSGRRVVKSARTVSHREAERKAAEWEQELRSGVETDPFRIEWARAFDKYVTEHLSGLSPRSREKPIACLEIYREQQRPRVMADITSQSVSRHVLWLRKTPYTVGKATRKRSETTVEGHVVALFGFFAWCRNQGYLAKLPARPAFERSRLRKGRMKGRPLTDAEFQAMLDAVPKVVTYHPEAFAKLLRGLWLGGFRLGEALALGWDGGPIRLDFSGRFPMVWIEAEGQKSFEDRLLPLAPEFAELVRDDPRSGKVFPLPKQRGDGDWTLGGVSAIITEIGRKAGVTVNRHGKPASAHDLRRSFGLRWADRVRPKELMSLMRHQEISTTMRYYVGDDAERAAERIWGAVDDALRATPPKRDRERLDVNSSGDAD